MDTEPLAPGALGVLAGEWTTEITHRLLPGTVLRGRGTFELLAGGKFLLLRERVDHPQFPDASLAVIGGAEGGALRMHYFDSRGVARVFALTIAGRVWTFQRDAPDFSALDFHQRITWTLGEDGRTISALGELAEDGVKWQDDIHVTYHRVGGGGR